MATSIRWWRAVSAWESALSSRVRFSACCTRRQLWGGWWQIALLVMVGIVFTIARAATRTVVASYILHLSYNCAAGDRRFAIVRQAAASCAAASLDAEGRLRHANYAPGRESQTVSGADTLERACGIG